MTEEKTLYQMPELDLSDALEPLILDGLEIDGEAMQEWHERELQLD